MSAFFYILTLMLIETQQNEDFMQRPGNDSNPPSSWACDAQLVLFSVLLGIACLIEHH